MGSLNSGQRLSRVTGAEALYADLGHFGLKPSLAWHWLCFRRFFYKLSRTRSTGIARPGTVRILLHMVPSGCFGHLLHARRYRDRLASADLRRLLSHNARCADGICALINIRHTSTKARTDLHSSNQYPACLGLHRLVISFKSSDALASAYGIAVTLTWSPQPSCFILQLGGCGNGQNSSRGTVCHSAHWEGTFLVGNSAKVMQGDGCLLRSAGGVPADDHMEKGPLLLRKNSLQMLSLRDLITSTTALGRESGLPARVPGTAVFFAEQPKGAPIPLLHNLKHNRVLHERNIVLTILTDRIPYIAKDARIEIKDLTHGFFRIIAHFGFMEAPTIGEVIECCAMKDFMIEELKTSFFLGRETIICTGKPGMARWREHLFVAMSHHAQTPAEFFKLPINRVVALGGYVEI